MKVKKVAENIISPLGFSVSENFQALKKGSSALRLYEDRWGLPFPFVASLIDDDKLDDAFAKDVKAEAFGYKRPTKFEKAALLSAVQAIDSSPIDPQSPRTKFILSSTKGNVELLMHDNYDEKRIYLGDTAKKIAHYFNNPNDPIVISNACISGLCAQIEAMRCIESGQYDSCVVIGADVLSPFIVAGFNCLKALSDEPCQPFSANRKGLNLGEAAATVIYSSSDSGAGWALSRGAIRNDANHISGPSRTGEGSFRALQYVLRNAEINNLACVSVHGTATPYNDEMEAVALSRAGLSSTPVSALKGYYGHTLGAAGILETLVTMHAIDNNTVLPTRGFDILGTTNTINVSNYTQTTDKQSFIKLLSGFGGCNAAAMFTK